MSFGKGGPKEQIVKNEIDPGMQDYRNYVFDKAKGVASQGYTPYGGQRVAGPNAASVGAMQGMGAYPGIFDSIGKGIAGLGNGSGAPQIGPYSQAGANAARALGGDQGAISSLMNPYQKNVIDALGTEYDRQRDKATMATNAEATGAGAFGGARQALLEGERLGALDRGQMSDVANLLNSNFNSTMDRAGQTANLGLGAQQLGSNYNLGQGQLRLGAGQLQLGAGQAGMNALGQQFGMGDYMRNIQQQGLDTNYQNFLDQRDWGNHQLEILKGAMSGAPVGSTQTQPLYKNGLNSVLGGAATGASIGGPIGGVVGGIGGLLFG